MKKIVAVFFSIVTLSTIGAQSYKSALKLTSPRMNGPEVQAVQEKLLALGFSKIGVADGWFGPLTKDAVSLFQRFYGYPDNGIVDSAIWAELMADFRKQLNIEAAIREANSISAFQLQKQSHDIMNLSTEGGSVDQYFSEEKLIIEDFFFYGEMGKVEYRVFHLNDGLVILKKDYQYPEPFNIKNATISNTGYYFLRNNSIMIDNGKIGISRLGDLMIHDIIGGNGG